MSWWCWPPYTGREQKAHAVSPHHSELVKAMCGKLFEAHGVRECNPAEDEKCKGCVKALAVWAIT